ncbi:unnamed protein product, partial [Ectocarpus sp. 12 AP-2014]
GCPVHSLPQSVVTEGTAIPQPWQTIESPSKGLLTLMQGTVPEGWIAKRSRGCLECDVVHHEGMMRVGQWNGTRPRDQDSAVANELPTERIS